MSYQEMISVYRMILRLRIQNIGQFKSQNLQNFTKLIFFKPFIFFCMNPNIRYRQDSGTYNSFKFFSDQIRQNDQSSGPVIQSKIIDNNSCQMPNQQFSDEPMLSRNKSHNIDIKSNQQNNFTMSYRLDSHSSSLSRQNIPYRTENNFYRPHQLHKCESAIDFFNQAASQVSPNIQELSKLQKTTSQTFNEPLSIRQTSKCINTNNQIAIQESKKYLKSQINGVAFAVGDCERCVQYEEQVEKIMKFMREQLQIGVKQYSQKMSKIIVEQAKQIKDLRKSLLNNQKNLIKMQRQTSNTIQRNYEKSLSPAQGLMKEKSPSKLSMTKSNSSISPRHGTKQKITMVSKELSPSKTYLISKHRNTEKQNYSMQRMASTIQQPSSPITYEEVIRKIKSLEQMIQLSYKFEGQRNEKNFLMNKRIEVLQKGVISVFAVKLQKIREGLNLWMQKQEEKQNTLYKELKVISSRVGTMSTHSTHHISSTHSITSIPLSHSRQQFNNSQQMSMNKVSLRLKKYGSEIEDLKQLATNLKTREFKYDSFQIDNLVKAMQEVQSRLYSLEKTKLHISHKLIQTEHKIQEAIEASKFSQIEASKYSQIEASKYSQIQANTQVNPQKEEENRVRKISFNRNNSVELIYTYKNQKLPQMGARSMKYQMSPNQGSKISKCTKMTSEPYSSFQPHSHSQFKDFLGEDSHFSQYVDQSVYHEVDKCRNQDQENSEQEYQQEESFQKSSDIEEDEEEEDDEFFYPVDLNTQSTKDEYIRINGSQSNKRIGREEGNLSSISHHSLPNANIKRFMQVIESRKNIPLCIQIDQTGYIKSAQNGMYIMDRNMQGFDLNKNQLDWLKQRGIIIIGH